MEQITLRQSNKKTLFKEIDVSIGDRIWFKSPIDGSIESVYVHEIRESVIGVRQDAPEFWHFYEHDLYSRYFAIEDIDVLEAEWTSKDFPGSRKMFIEEK